MCYMDFSLYSVGSVLLIKLSGFVRGMPYNFSLFLAHQRAFDILSTPRYEASHLLDRQMYLDAISNMLTTDRLIF